MTTVVDYERFGAFKQPKSKEALQKIESQITLCDRPSPTSGFPIQQSSPSDMGSHDQLPIPPLTEPERQAIVPVHANFSQPPPLGRIPELPPVSATIPMNRTSTFAMYPPNWEGVRPMEDPLPHPGDVITAPKMERCYSCQSDRTHEFGRPDPQGRQHEFEFRQGFRSIDWRAGGSHRPLEVRTADQRDSRWHSTYPEHGFGPPSATSSSAISPATHFGGDSPQVYPSRIQYDYTPVELSAQRSLSDAGTYGYMTHGMSNLALQREQPSYPMEPYRPIGVDPTGGEMMEIDSDPRLRSIESLQAGQIYRPDSMGDPLGYGLAQSPQTQGTSMPGQLSQVLPPPHDETMRQ